MNIGELATAAGVTAKLIRHYEGLGIIPKAARTRSGYRIYTEEDVECLRFVRHARSFNFSTKEIKKLVNLWRTKDRACKDVRAVVKSHLDEIEIRICGMQAIAARLQELVENCPNDSSSDCNIFAALR